MKTKNGACLARFVLGHVFDLLRPDVFLGMLDFGSMLLQLYHRHKFRVHSFPPSLGDFFPRKKLFKI